MIMFVPGAGHVGGVEHVAEVLGGEGAEVVAGDERQVVVVRRAAAAGWNLWTANLSWRREHSPKPGGITFFKITG